MTSKDTEEDFSVTEAESVDGSSETRSHDDARRTFADQNQNQAIPHHRKFSWFCWIIVPCCLSACCAISFRLGVVVGQVGIFEDSPADQTNQAILQQLLQESKSGSPDALNQQWDRVVKLIATEFLEPYVRNIEVGRIQFNHVEITNLRISSMSLGNFILGASGKNFVLNIQGISAKATASWKASKKVLRVRIRKSGSAEVSVKGISTRQEVTVDKKNGRLSVSVGRCLAHVGDLNVKVRGGALGWIIDQIVDLFERKIKKTLGNELIRYKMAAPINNRVNVVMWYPILMGLAEMIAGLLEGSRYHENFPIIHFFGAAHRTIAESQPKLCPKSICNEIKKVEPQINQQLSHFGGR